MDETLPAELMRIWESRGIALADLAPDERGTIRPPPESAPPTAGPEGGAWHSEPIEAGSTLGAGSMGLVHLGWQSALRRPVAVKVPVPDDGSRQAADALLREAWVTGNLEHPNIVPVYDLQGDTRVPRLVMRRVEGTSWSTLLADPRASEHLHGGDALAFHLSVLIQVCHAVHYAHSRGTLHLDIKPSNVMVGAFGEVYLLDWGLAAGLPGEAAGERAGPPPEWLPQAASIRSVCGTPGYMAPEQAAGDGASIGVHTDVYLLGAVLHRILAGRAPHARSGLAAAVRAAWESAPPTYGSAAPRELQQIVRRALARDPGDRFASAADLRLALERFLEHRDSDRLAEGGRLALARLERWSAATEAGQGEAEARGLALFAECRFAFQQALASWPDNHEAADGLQWAVTLMAERALQARDASRAQVLLNELPRDDAALRARCDALEAELAREAARQRDLEKLRHELDPRVHQRTRSRLAALLGVAWILVNTGAGALVRAGALTLTYPLLLGAAAACLLLYTVAVSLIRRRFLTTAANRRAATMFGAGFVFVAALYASCWRLGLEPLEAVAMGVYIYFYFAVAIAVFFERRAWIGAAIVGPLAPLVAFVPALALEAAALMGGFVALLLAWLWRRGS